MANIVTTHNSKAKRNLKIAKDHLNGATYRDLMQKYDISNASISRILNKDEIKDVLDTALNHLVTFAPLIVRNYRMLLNSDKPSIRLKATEALAKILGISSTHAGTQINMMFNQNNTTIVSDKMRDIIDKLSGNDSFIDAEFTSIIDD